MISLTLSPIWPLPPDYTAINEYPNLIVQGLMCGVRLLLALFLSATDFSGSRFDLGVARHSEVRVGGNLRRIRVLRIHSLG